MTTKEVAQICGVTEKTMTTREVADALGTSVKVIIENARKCLPNKKIENGKATYWTEPECSAIKLQMKKNETGNQNKALLQSKGRVMLPSEAKIEMIHAIDNAFNVLEPTELKECMNNIVSMLQMSLNKSLERYEEEHKQKLLALEQKEQAEANYQAEKQEHQKDKELVLHKYLTAAQIKETIFKEYGKNIVVSKAVQRIPLDDNDILYKPFTNGNYTGQQPVYHPDVLDKIREILG